MVPPAEPGFKPAVPVRPQLAPTAGDILARMIESTRRRDHRSVKRHRQHLRQHYRLSVTLGKVVTFASPAEIGHVLDSLVGAAGVGNFSEANVLRKSLLRLGVAVVPLERGGPPR